MAVFIQIFKHLCLFLILHPMVNGFIFVPSDAEMTPNDPLVEDGGELVLNCTLAPHYGGPYNSSHISFDHANQTFVYPTVRPLSDKTAQLQLTNVTVDMNGLFRCSLPNKSFLGVLSRQHIHVARRPMKPVISSCIVKNWEEMECNWGPSKSHQNDYTHSPNSFNQTLFWKYPEEDETWRTCPRNISETCTWPFSFFMMEKTYCLQVNASNILSHIVSSNISCFKTEDIVKPSPPANVHTTVTDGWVNISWDAPISLFKYSTPLVYNLIIHSQWGEMANVNLTRETSKTISIIPFTNYDVVLNASPFKNGYASEYIKTLFQTPATAPCKNPSTTTNAFYLSKIDSSHRKIVLYWQAIKIQEFCGLKFGYQIRARVSGSGNNWVDVGLPTPNCSMEIELNNSFQDVAIVSRNDIGLSVEPFTIIHVPSVAGEQLLYNFELVVEVNSGSASVHWFSLTPLSNVTGFTLFWCQCQSVLHICKSSIQWRDFESMDHEYNLTYNGDYHLFQVGLAIRQPDRSSGIMWASRLYSMTSNAAPPQDVIVIVPSEGHHGELMVRWKAPSCNTECAYIRSFIILYCVVSSKSHCQGDVQSVAALSRASEYLLEGLDHGSTYKVWMKSVARTGLSKSSNSFTATTTASWATSGTIAGIVIAILFAGVIIVFGCYITCRFCNEYKKKLMAGPIIKLPESSHRVALASTSSEAPMLVIQTSLDYCRQQSRMSTVSGDSGHFSLGVGPGSPAMLPLLTKEPSNLDHVIGCIDKQSVKGSFETTIFNSEFDDKSSHKSTEKSEDEDGGQGFIVTYSIVSNCLSGTEVCLPQSGLLSDVGSPKHTIYLQPDEVAQNRPLLCQQNSCNLLKNVNDNNNITATQRDEQENRPDIGYTKIEHVTPFFEYGDQLDTSSSDRSDLLVDLEPIANTSAACMSVSVPIVSHLEELLANLQCHPETNALKINREALTSDKNLENKLPNADDQLVCTYTVLASTSNPELTCSEEELRIDEPDLVCVPQQPYDYGYVEHGRLLSINTVS